MSITSESKRLQFHSGRTCFHSIRFVVRRRRLRRGHCTCWLWLPICSVNRIHWHAWSCVIRTTLRIGMVRPWWRWTRLCSWGWTWRRSNYTLILLRVGLGIPSRERLVRCYCGGGCSARGSSSCYSSSVFPLHEVDHEGNDCNYDTNPN